ncbi:MAG: CotS family spore coat protein [Halanaerobiales bacterium]|nr:CotS family spore coat protein [Halanaerobiales bacterium]
MQRPEVKQILELWGIEMYKVRLVRNIYKIWTDQGIYCLKPVTERGSCLRFFDSVLRHVQSRDFQVQAHYEYTQNGEPFGVFNGNRWILTPWIDGKEIKYRSFKEVIEGARVLAKFHQAAEGYVPEIGIKVKDKQGKWPDKLVRRVGDIKDYIQTAQAEDSDFDRYFLKYADWILKSAEETLKLICNSNYDQKVEDSLEQVQICHGDPASRNFVIDKKGQIHMIDFDSMKFDLPVVDLWRFLRRVLNRNQWNMRLVTKIIDGYNSERRLDQDDYRLLAIFLEFPEKIWRVLHHYYERRGRENWSQYSSLRKLLKLLAQVEEREKFLAEFRNAYLKTFLE